VTYERVTITDGQRPKDVDVDKLIDIFRRALRNQQWCHFHCRDGHGRTTTAMVMYHIFHLANQMTIFEITDKHTIVDVMNVKPSTKHGPIPPTPLGRMPDLRLHEFQTWVGDRAAFLFQFYKFVRLNWDALHDVSKPWYAFRPQWKAFAATVKAQY